MAWKLLVFLNIIALLGFTQSLDVEKKTAILNDHCYWVSQEKELTFQQAEEYCVKFGAHLISILTKEEDDFLFQHLKETAPDQWCWSGVHRTDTIGLRWTDGTYFPRISLNIELGHAGLMIYDPVIEQNQWSYENATIKKHAFCKQPLDQCKSPYGFDKPQNSHGSMESMQNAGFNFFLFNAWCKMDGGHLGSVPNATIDAKFRQELIDDGRVTSAWIGLIETKEEGKHWIGGEKLQYLNPDLKEQTKNLSRCAIVDISKEHGPNYHWDLIDCNATQAAGFCTEPEPNGSGFKYRIKLF